MVRTPSCDENGMKKCTWTSEEDRMLVAYVTRYGCWNWRQLPRFAGLKRCGKSCRLRWMNYLRPNLKRGNYTKEEEETIIRLHRSMGNKWSTIAGQLPGRTDNEVKNHWHTHLKKRENQQQEYSFSDDDQLLLGSNESPASESNNPQNVDTTISQPTVIVMSPQPSSTSSEVDSNTTTTTSSSNNYLVAESNFSNVTSNNNNPFEDFSGFIDDFWTEPFLADNSCVPNATDFFSPDFDENYLLFTGENYWYQEHAQI